MDNLSKRPILRLFTIAASLLVVVMFVAYAISSIVNWNETSRQIDFLNGEINNLALPPNSSRTSPSNSVSRKPRQATVYAGFVSELSVLQIDTFYEAELLKKGWTFYDRRDHADESTVEYCKGNYGFKIRRTLQPAPKDWNYILYLGWSARGCVL